MKLIKIKLDDVKPYEKNPRKNENAVDIVIKSIEQCEYIAPIIIDENNIILAGHTRYKALKKLNYDYVEVIKKENLTDEQKKKYRILDNKTNEFSQWDFELLQEEIKNLDFEGLEIDWLINNDDAIDAINLDDFFVENNNKTNNKNDNEQEKLICPNCGFCIQQ